jgi:hypothetical protein
MTLEYTLRLAAGAVLTNLDESQLAMPSATDPEPASQTMFGIGVTTLAGYGWWRRKAT